MQEQKLPATGTPGPRVTPADVPSVPASVPLYDAGTVRTTFLTFERDDWERELPALRTRYLQYVAEIAERHLEPSRFAARVARYAALIGEEVARDTRKTGTTEAYRAGVDGSGDVAGSLRVFAERRRAALLAHPEVVKARNERR